MSPARSPKVKPTNATFWRTPLKQNGVEIQTYIAIIACLWILIHTGRAPTKQTFEMIWLSMSGWASLEEQERHIEKLKAANK